MVVSESTDGVVIGVKVGCPIALVTSLWVLFLTVTETEAFGHADVDEFQSTLAQRCAMQCLSAAYPLPKEKPKSDRRLGAESRVRWREQVGSAPLRSRECLISSPALDGGVVARKKNFRNPRPLEFDWAGVLREFEQTGGE
ncbi:MAG: hypothetical protein RLZZ399_1163 [Verrucomicrobiota bacterium]